LGKSLGQLAFIYISKIECVLLSREHVYTFFNKNLISVACIDFRIKTQYQEYVEQIERTIYQVKRGRLQNSMTNNWTK